MFPFTQLDFPGETGHVYSLGRSLSPSWRTRSGTRHLWILWILWIWKGSGWLKFKRLEVLQQLEVLEVYV